MTQIPTSKFYAYLSRLRWIKRWGLMRNAESENVVEHSWDVATIAHALALIGNHYYAGQFDANAIATAALYHDAGEVITGDLPTPIKYHSKNLTRAYQHIEALANQELLALLPDKLRPAYQQVFLLEQQPENHRRIIKAADTLAAYLKCRIELRAGNLEFKQAALQNRQKLESYRMREVDFFMRVFMPDCELPLDGLLLDSARANRPMEAFQERG
ncbi:5'-deoxynucleotidase [Candidatus Methylospira mobilis]|uniref:5'-deoxynucleotidase n=1 Tax=Candidatus Methylospira mobilis TaxID=1808979 RepID=A0A5Q0BR21_9GAMM|nr:5'-deoxynucleotidase [Candidatus Methylospira mobilis]QFY44527.1 5'-deoxynucleotidase [Candidatus Methylospira mobilis]